MLKDLILAYLFVIAQAGSLQVMPIVQNTDPFIVLPMTKAPTYPILFAHHKNTSSTYDSYSGNIFFITVPCER